MAKDPAFLFYYQDFLVGTSFMSDTEVGIYTRLLCHMADKGVLSKEHILSICGAYGFAPVLQTKFDVDSDGMYYNERLRVEVEKRKKYAESRRKNASAYAKHMENENEDINVLKGGMGEKAENEKDLQKRKEEFSRKVDAFCNLGGKYPQSMGLAFISYWTEHNEGGRKMRFEMQRVFDISKRLATWNKNNTTAFGKTIGVVQKAELGRDRNMKSFDPRFPQQ